MAFWPLTNSWWDRLQQRLWRTLHSNVAAVNQHLSLIFGTAGYETPPPSSATVAAANAIFDLLREREAASDDDTRTHALRKLQELAEGCSELDSLLLVLSEVGYSVLQTAVIADDADAIDVLASEGCALNHAACSPPLHLACRLGNASLVRILLRHGASVALEAGMCHPRPHRPTRHVPSRFHFLETDIFACDAQHRLPLMYAIEADSADVVELLLEQSLFECPYRRLPLHHACLHGAYASMRYLAGALPHDVDSPDDGGATPLLLAAPWGRAFVEFLLQQGAQIGATSKRQETALHRLYAHAQRPLELYGTTLLLLASGLEAESSRLDVDGNTALHLLTKLVNRSVDTFGDGGRGVEQDDFDAHVISTMELLLSHNCDPNVRNTSSVTAMHSLLLLFDGVASGDHSMVATRDVYRLNVDVLHAALATLCRHGSTPDMPTGAGRTALVLLLQSTLNMQPSLTAQCGAPLLRCVALLCDSGCKPSAPASTHTAVVTLLARYGHACLEQRDAAVQTCMADLLRDELALLLRHGLNPNHRSEMRQRNVHGASGNLLVELVRLVAHVRCAEHLAHVHAWLLTCLQWGANPDLEPYPSESIICHSQSSIYLKSKGTQPVNTYMYEIQDFAQIFEGGHCERLLLLFYNSMEHAAIYQCLETARFMARFDPHRSPTSAFVALVSGLAGRPRSLKQMARVAIYKALERQLRLRVQHLPLPRALQNFLLDVE